MTRERHKREREIHKGIDGDKDRKRKGKREREFRDLNSNINSLIVAYFWWPKQEVTIDF